MGKGGVGGILLEYYDRPMTFEVVDFVIPLAKKVGGITWVIRLASHISDMLIICSRRFL